ncbi:LPXTG cell wall anchor domain-containing protein [Brevibacterium luteolum]|uniref:LPXTG cell wall anchor domain-containing protein n=1 Tax=Brevibacterium luteolum TaxID=199591 RepID=UPI0021AFDA3A|nr:LPXTG cell wall anchor domain-containing protein [Brevibacterium luteolum]MCT1872264.1 LPXTG cell wall anchor domain-containing protein [Brevibacterium luteolum]MCT1889527.1 LPXTG cell wall anchor domain-containing protein [Brevibacterium luteolum]MCT1892085.1 LPXTG cell wall anchor domain-containing protein [Brevibacterium luteolum]MCT1922850.1 LPXTG cell wall anchor domain-containing protein [Brevibacterium luteolum]
MPETSALQHAPARRVVRVLLAVLAALALALDVLPATATTASASAPIEVSVDGENWAPKLPRQLFDSVDRLSPGDRVNDTVWLRNATAAPIAVRVQMRWIGPADTAAIDDAIAVGMNGSSATVRQLRAEPLTVDLGKLAPQATARLDAEAVLPFSAPNATQSRYLELDLILQLSGDDDPGPSGEPRPDPPASSTPPGPEGDSEDGERSLPRDDEADRWAPLPRTGAETLLLLAAGLVAIGVGITALLVARHRRRNAEAGSPER